MNATRGPAGSGSWHPGPQAVPASAQDADADDPVLATLALLREHRAADAALTAVDELLDGCVDPGRRPDPAGDEDALDTAVVELRASEALHRAALAATARVVPAPLLDFLR